MPSLDQPNTLGDGIRFESESDYSREKKTVISGQNLAVLAVVGMITASSKITLLAPAATDGSEVAAGIMVAPCDASAADTGGAVLVRHALITSDSLAWPDGILAGEKTQALAELADLGIHARETA